MNTGSVFKSTAWVAYELGYSKYIVQLYLKYSLFKICRNVSNLHCITIPYKERNKDTFKRVCTAIAGGL